MNTVEWPPRIGTWYLRWDRGEVFQVTGYDDKTHKASIVSYDGVSAEIDEITWDGLSLGVADPPEDWTGPLETVDVINLGTSQSDPVSEDVAEPRASVE
ncbi:MAG TPA: DUF6763 family protein [Steroidobacteraceae bacterium]